MMDRDGRLQRLGRLLALALGLQGCVATWTGHGIPREKLAGFAPGQTTPAEVEAALGKPENVMFKSANRVTIYVYQAVRSMNLGLPLPISLGRSAQKGITLHVVFKEGVFQEYELVEMKQKLFWR